MKRVPHLAWAAALLALIGCTSHAAEPDVRLTTTAPVRPAVARPGDAAAVTLAQSGGTPQISVRTVSNRTPADSSRTAAAADLKPPRKIGGALELTFDHIKFDMEIGSEFKRELITESIEDLVGKKIRIRGYILPAAQQKLRNFVLVRDNMECCFGPGAALYDCVIVNMKGSAVAEYTTRPVAVEGVFSIEVLKDDFDGSTLAIYHLDGEAVK